MSDPYIRDAESAREPPRTIGDSLRHLGPGLILAGSIVGSGELILTVKLGAQAGFAALWFVLLSCVIKLFVSTELARHTISSGETTLVALNQLPGPAMNRPHWMTWHWLISVGVVVIGGLIGTLTTGLRLAPAVVVIVGVTTVSLVCRRQVQFVPELPEQQGRINWFICGWLLCQFAMFVTGGAILGGAGQCLHLLFADSAWSLPAGVWSLFVGVVCAAILLNGRYERLELACVGLVATFSAISVACVFMLQGTEFRWTAEQLSGGLVPTSNWPSFDVLVTMMAVYAVTGVGHWEQLGYPYWCIEKGYARFTGPRTDDDQWQQRAQGWIRVMYLDSAVNLVVYTGTTVCFYLLGAAVLNRQQMVPSGEDTLATLQRIYVEALGPSGAGLFLFGAFCVLFTTVLSGVAGNSRILADGLGVMGFYDLRTVGARLRVIRFGIPSLLVGFAASYWFIADPPLMLVLSGVVALFVYPSVAVAALWFRYRRLDVRILPGRLVTAGLWISAVTLLLGLPLVTILLMYRRLAE